MLNLAGGGGILAPKALNNAPGNAPLGRSALRDAASVQLTVGTWRVLFGILLALGFFPFRRRVHHSPTSAHADHWATLGVVT
jgi:hypothetical protein